MPKEALFQPYYYRLDGTKNGIVASLGNCFTKCVYFVMQGYFDEPEYLYKLYIENMTFKLVEDRNGNIINLISNNTVDISEYILKDNRKTIIGNGAKSMHILEKLIDKGHVVFIKTIPKKLPFYFTYTKGKIEKESDMNSGHIFLALHIEDDKVYFLDNAANYHKENFVPCAQNANIGVIPKNELLEAFNLYFQCFTIEPDIHKISKMDENIIKTLTEMTENYYDIKTSILNEYSVSNGRRALERFVEICRHQQVYMNQPVYILKKGEFEKVYDITLWLSIKKVIEKNTHSKRVLTYLLSKALADAGQKTYRILESCEKSMNIFHSSKAFIFKEYLQKNYLINSSIIKVFEKMMKAEDEFFDQIKGNEELICRVLKKI